MATYQDIKKEIDKLEKEAERLFKTEVRNVIKTIQQLMTDYGLSLSDLGSDRQATKKVKAKAKSKKATAPKYRDPQSGATWSGRGRSPAWLAEALKSGKADAFLIANQETGGTAPTKKLTAKAAPAKKAAAKKPATRRRRKTEPTADNTAAATETH